MIDQNTLQQIESGAGIKQTTTLGDIVSRIIPYIYMAAGIALLIYIIFGGYQIMTAGGDSKKIEAGKQILTNALVGFMIVFVSFWIVQALALILGLTPVITIFGGGTTN